MRTPFLLVLASCLAVACSVAPTLLTPQEARRCPEVASQPTSGTDAADPTGDPTTGTTGAACDPEPAPRSPLPE